MYRRVNVDLIRKFCMPSSVDFRSRGLGLEFIYGGGASDGLDWRRRADRLPLAAAAPMNLWRSGGVRRRSVASDVVSGL